MTEQKKVKLQFMVADLDRVAYVPDPIKIKIIDPDTVFLLGILGESGRVLVKNGVAFYFTRSLAKKLIEKGIAEEVK